MIKELKNESIDPITALKYSHKAAYKHNSPFLLIKEFVSSPTYESPVTIYYP